MPPQSRIGDKSQAPVDAHGCPSCPHPVIGPAITGSHNVFTNGRFAVRTTDKGLHAACCTLNTWFAVTGSATVTINMLFAHRVGDKDMHCGGVGFMIEGSHNVFVGG